VHPARGRFVVLGDDGSFDVVGPLGAFGRQVPVFSALEVGPLLLDLAEAVLVFLGVILPLRIRNEARQSGDHSVGKQSRVECA
jgi:hypothetical protein